MAANGIVKNKGPDRPWWINPLVIMGVGLGLVVIGLVVPGAIAPLFVFLGLVAVGAATWVRLAQTGWELEDRAGSAGLLTLAAVASGIAAYALGGVGWDSLAMASGVGVGVSLAGALLVLMPPLARRLAITVLVLVHFLGIVTAVTSVPPPNGSAPFLVSSAWTYFYRNYLQFAYLNNAYHFYSPDPGPPSLLWFAIDYEKGHPRWVMLPAREQYRTRQDYQRYLALAEYSNMVNPMPPPAPIFNEMWKLRAQAGTNLNVPLPPEDAAPRNMLFRRPLPFSEHMIASYARYVARNFPSDAGPDDKVKSVKAYRVAHNILGPDLMANRDTQGWSPTGRDTYFPFYLGEFDGEGKLKRGLPVFDPRTGALVNGAQSDPFLYWAMPMGWKAKPGHEDKPFPTPKTHDPVDNTDIHAGFSKEQSEKVYGPSPGH